ncbi:acyltransferase family protein [Paenibacillus rigui]|uniref:Acyltransferase 3 domain-containing protein n=1 Tax=Paenibacillus rigui TaxID=554312 RepID=A0A229UTA7_9BACL|nr:acyltransferase family protein [Paenibacillus rigui]OXM86563.1 hypothetical protein CF651_08895 [Paenibacillus rigui]
MLNQGKGSAYDTYFLNTRFVLIVLVVIGNLLMPLLPRDAEAQAIVLTIFTFHMPVFVFVTGHFSKSFPKDPHAMRILMTIVLQYVIFQSLYSALDFLFFHTGGTIYSFWAPYWMLWFLFSHLCWKLLLLLFIKIKQPLAAAVLIGIAVGYLPFDGLWLSVSRTFVFFPFFLAGYYYRGEWLQKAARQPLAKLAGSLVLLLVIAGFYSGRLPAGIDWLLGSRTYGELHLMHWYAGLYRMGYYAAAVLVSAAFLLLQTERKGRLTEWGERTVYVFLLHGAGLKLLAAAGLYSMAGFPAGIPVLLGSAIVLTVLLSHARVAALTHPLIHPDPVLLSKARHFRRA